jgi:CubicO group peptidase (beta-lactamase class C family)
MNLRKNAVIAAALIIGVTGVAMATEPSPVKATGVINAEFGADRSNWDNPPHNMYSFTLTERIFPTVIMSRGEGPVTPLSYAPNQIDITKVFVSDPATGRRMSVEDLLNRRIVNSGLIAMYKGQVVHESYRSGFSRELRHINLSTAKSFVGMMAQIAKQKGCFDENDLASKYVQELEGKEAWSDVTVRHVWDMRDGTEFVEDYQDEQSDVRVQDRATGWRPGGVDGPKGVREFIAQNLENKIKPTGKAFNYSSIQTEVLGLIIQESCGVPLATFLEEEFWSKLGAEHDAGFGTDGHGQPIGQGAISMTLPDFARAAMLVRNKGKTHSGDQIIDAAFFEDLVTPNKELVDAFPAGFAALFGDTANYRSQFWVLDAAAGQFIMVGVYGQLAYFDTKNDFSMVAFGSYPIAKDALLVSSFGTLIEAMLGAVAPDIDAPRPNMNVFLVTGR